MNASNSNQLPSAAAHAAGRSAAAFRIDDPREGSEFDLLRTRCAEAVELLKALANTNRLMLLCELIGGERTVAELGTSTGVRQPTLSQQLAVLRAQRLVATRRQGKSMHYRVASPAVLAVLGALHGLYGAASAGPTRRNLHPELTR